MIFALGTDMGLQDSDRLDSEFLNPMPSDLAAQLEAHRNPDGELMSVPSDLARQIEDHRKETKARPHHLCMRQIMGASEGECISHTSLFDLRNAICYSVKP